VSDKPRKLVYVVEDDEEQLALLRLLLNHAGFDVVTETSADRVLESARKLRPDVILLDVMLPSNTGLDGFHLCVELRKIPELGGVKLVIVSAIAKGVGEKQEKIRHETGADDYIVKPYDPAALVRRLQELTG
jgi:DNA-binding response OmpR family regulator